MYVTRIANRNSPPAVLLRKSFREDGKVKSRTLANISHWPEAKIEALRRVLANETILPLAAQSFGIERSLAHGHVAAVLGTVRRLKLGAVLGLGEVDEEELYGGLDLLARAQPGIEQILARRHLKDGTLVLYDVSSSYLEGRHCELAQFGYSRDHRPDRPQ